MCWHALIFFGQASPVTLSFSGTTRIGAGTVKVGMFKRHLLHVVNGHDAVNRFILCSDGETPQGSLQNSEGEAVTSEPLNQV